MELTLEPTLEPTCRICYTDGDDKLIAPCQCNGSMKYVHQSCWENWLFTSGHEVCNVCNCSIDSYLLIQWILFWPCILTGEWLTMHGYRETKLMDIVMCLVSLVNVAVIFTFNVYFVLVIQPYMLAKLW